MKILLTISLLIATSITNASDSHFLVPKLDKVGFENRAKIANIFKAIKKDDIVIAPIHWSSVICQFDKSIVSYKDQLSRDIVACSYTGEVRALF